MSGISAGKYIHLTSTLEHHADLIPTKEFRSTKAVMKAAVKRMRELETENEFIKAQLDAVTRAMEDAQKKVKELEELASEGIEDLPDPTDKSIRRSALLHGMFVKETDLGNGVTSRKVRFK